MMLQSTPPPILLGIFLAVFIGCLTNPASAFLNHHVTPTAVDRRLAQQQQPLQATPTPTPTPTSTPTSSKETSVNSISSIEQQLNLHFRPATPNDMDACFAIESASYPADEAASREGLEYRQSHASLYFRVVTITTASTSTSTTGAKEEDETIIGFCCSTRCHAFTEEAMSTTHAPDGKLLAIHSVVVAEPYRRRGIATAMLKEYMENISSNTADAAATDAASTAASTAATTTAADGLESIVLLAKSKLLTFYINCGFAVLRPSPIVHGSELWYELEKRLAEQQQTVPNEDEHQ